MNGVIVLIGRKDEKKQRVVNGKPDKINRPNKCGRLTS